MFEIERKFLVKGDFYPYISKTVGIKQGYLCIAKGRTVRVRIKDDSGFITIKSPANTNGFSRLEFEYPVPLADAEAMLKLCPPIVIDKERHYVPVGNHTFEVDVFHGVHEGLVIAELELGSEEEAFVRPDWLGEEVTANKRYYNAYLSIPSNHS